MAKKIYYVELHEFYLWECRIAIDEDFVTPFNDDMGQTKTAKDLIKEQVEFWAWWEERLADNDGDYTKTFLQQMGKSILYTYLEKDWNLEGIINHYSAEPFKEGWYPIDGSCGIELLDMDTPEISPRDFTVRVEEVEA